MKSNSINQARLSMILFCLGAVLNACSGPKSDHSDKDKLRPEDAISPTEANESSNETTGIPVYAVWRPKTQNLSYDGLFDSSSRFIRLCQTKEKLHIDDLSELTIRLNDNCYTQKASLMIIISKDSAPPLYLKVLHVDTINNNAVGVTDDNDTIVTTIRTMNSRSLQLLKREYEKTSMKEEDVKKVETFYLPEKAVENQERKSRVMKVNAARYTQPK